MLPAICPRASVQPIDPSAGIVCPLLCVYVLLQVSEAVVHMVEQLEPVRQAIFEAQTAYGQTRWNEHLAVDLRLAGRSVVKSVSLHAGSSVVCFSSTDARHVATPSLKSGSHSLKMQWLVC